MSKLYSHGKLLSLWFCYCVSFIFFLNLILFFKICEVRNYASLVSGEEVEIRPFFPSPLT